MRELLGIAMLVVIFALPFIMAYSITNVDLVYGNNVNSSMSANTTSSSDSTTSSNTNLGIKVMADGNGNNLLISGETNASTDLEIASDDNVQVYLSNGEIATVRISPEEAAQVAISQTGGYCNGSCEVELEEENENGTIYAAYEVETHKKAKLWRVFSMNMAFETDVDAQTGAVIDTQGSWWAFMATDTNTSGNTGGGAGY